MVGEFVRWVGKLTGIQAQKSLIAGTSGKVLGIRNVKVTSSAATTFRLQDDGTIPRSLTAIHELVAGVQLELDYPRPQSAPKTQVGNGVTATNSAGNVAIEIEYWLEP